MQGLASKHRGQPKEVPQRVNEPVEGIGQLILASDSSAASPGLAFTTSMVKA